MITVGLIKELNYISVFFKKPVEIKLYLTPEPISVRVEDNTVYVEYKNNIIWVESIEGPTSFFGVESCDTISRIIVCIDNKDDSWKKLYYYNEVEKS